MAQYYRWVKENQKAESVIVLKEWTTTEAEYQMQATEFKHGLKSGNPPWMSCRSGGRKGRSYGTNQVDGKKKEAYKVCGGSHAIWKCDFLRKEVFRRNGVLQRS